MCITNSYLFLCINAANPCLTEALVCLLIQERAGLQTALDIITYRFKPLLLFLSVLSDDGVTVALSLSPACVFLSGCLSLFYFSLNHPLVYFRT